MQQMFAPVDDEEWNWNSLGTHWLIHVNSKCGQPSYNDYSKHAEATNCWPLLLFEVGASISAQFSYVK
jgi:hypothetical protein